MPRSVYIKTLGCPKNEADTSNLRGILTRAGYRITSASSKADVVVVNTCAFIETARQESVDAVLDALQARVDGQKVVVSGCLVERYGRELEQELPEVDAFMGLGSYGRTEQIFESVLNGDRMACFDPGKVPLNMDRPDVPRSATALLKISEGCDRVCTFCAIPSIRGPHRSRPMDSIFDEANWLASNGVREVVLVGQDMSLYGRDLTGKWQLPGLIRSLGEIGGLKWVRTLYHYPRFINDELLGAIAATPSAVPYLDLSLQHSSGRLVRKMKRWGDGARFLEMIAKIRAYQPDAVLRSAFIIGFPGECTSDVDDLAEFLREARIDWAGFFPYSRESGTEAGGFTRLIVSKPEANRRIEALISVQDEIAEASRQSLVGAEIEVLAERRHRNVITGRTYREAPDVDGSVTVVGASTRVGEFLRCEVTGRDGLDLIARPLRRRLALTAS